MKEREAGSQKRLRELSKALRRVRNRRASLAAQDNDKQNSPQPARPVVVHHNRS